MQTSTQTFLKASHNNYSGLVLVKAWTLQNLIPRLAQCTSIPANLKQSSI